jgi:ornithine cyclodeaminase
MLDGEILILKGHEISALLANRESELINLARAVYEAHARNESSLPHSTFLRFPNSERDRIIALPAYLGGGFNIAGIKWISSFPGNLSSGLDRASAVVILNSMITGRPQAILEGSVISAKRTAASAALAAHNLLNSETVDGVGLVGCGVINFEITRMLLATFPALRRLLLFDTDPARARQFSQKCKSLSNEIEVMIAEDIRRVWAESSLISLATTAVKPHIYDLSACSSGAAILHISLRDLAPELILSCDNIVDDVDHVCRAQTSLHLAEQLVGHRDFIRCSLADILSGAAPSRRDSSSVAVFSPFGLGALDIAVSKFVCDLAIKEDQGLTIGSFFPSAWRQEPGCGT